MHLSRKSFLKVIFAGVAALAFCAPIHDAAAQRAGFRWETHSKANIKFEVPNDWKATVDGNTLVTTAPDNKVAIEFVAVADMSKEAKIEDAVKRELLKLVPDAQNNGPAKPATQNGLSGAVVAGTGTRKGRAVEYIAFVMGDGKGHGVIGLALAGKGEFATHKDKVVEVLNSVKAAS
jgi:predicted Zn-dependent protease